MLLPEGWGKGEGMGCWPGAGERGGDGALAGGEQWGWNEVRWIPKAEMMGEGGGR